MENHPLLNKTVYLMITGTTGQDLQSVNLSIQKALMKSDGKYDITCMAANDKNAETETRHGKYSIKEQSDKKLVLDVEEETGKYTGHYLVTYQWLDKNTGTVLTKKEGNGSSVQGIFQITS